MNDAAKWWYYVRQNGGYYPQTVANLGYNVWDWDANRKTGYINGEETTLLWQDSAKTTPVASNSDPVGAWVDGVQGVDAIQVTTANKPTYVTASLNGLPTLGFDGGDLLSTTNISISTFAVWVVFRANGLTQYPYEHSASSVSNDGMALLTGSTYRVRRGGVIAIKTSIITMDDSTYRIVRIEHNGTFATFNGYFNNVSSGATATANDVGTDTTTQPLYIGARSNLSGGVIGNIAHLCIVSPYPTDASIIANMESYINGLWGVY